MPMINRTEDRILNTLEPTRKPMISRVQAGVLAQAHMENVIKVIAETEDILERKALWDKLAKTVTPRDFIIIRMKAFVLNGTTE